MGNSKLANGITLRSIIFGSVFSVLLLLWIQWGFWQVNIVDFRGWPGSLYTGELGMNSAATYLPVLAFAMIPVLINAILPKGSRFSLQELAVINAMICPSILIPSMSTMYGGIGFIQYTLYKNIVTTRYGDVPALNTPSLWVPDLETLQLMDAGGVAVPWGAWSISIAYWIVFFLSFYFSQIFGAGLLRKTYIDSEALPFPYSTITTETLSLTSGEQKSTMDRKWLLMGLGIGIIGTFIIFTGGPTRSRFFQGFIPGMAEAGINTSLWAYLDLTKYQFVSGPLMFMWQPYMFGFALLLPVSMTTTSIISGIVGTIVAPGIALSIGQMGYPADWAWNAGAQRISETISGEYDAFTWFRGGYFVFALGAFVAIGLWPLILNRKDLLDSLKAAINPGATDESREAMPYRYLWTGFIASSLLLLVTMVAVTPIGGAILLILELFVICLGWTRMQGYSSNWLGGPFRGAAANYIDNGYWQVTASAAASATGWGTPAAYPLGTLTTVTNSNFMIGQTNQACWTLEALSIAEKTKTGASGVFKSLLIATAIAVIIGIPSSIWILNTYGMQGHFTGYPFSGPIWLTSGTFWHAPGYVPNEGMMFLFIMGVLTVIALTTLRSKVGGIFNMLHPAGIWLGLTLGYAYLLPFIVSTIVNMVVLRMGGAKIHREKVQPLAIGLILGYTILIIPAMLVLISRV